MRRHYLVSIGGSAIPNVPTKDFSAIPEKLLAGAWELVGPSVERNIQKHPLWKVIAAAYIEGVNHGAGAIEAAHGIKE